MLIIGRREYVIPPWLQAVVPAAFGLFATLRLISSPYWNMTLPGSDPSYLFYVTQIATGAVAGFLLIDLARRSVITWYGLLLLLPLSWGITSLAIDLLKLSANKASMLDLLLLFTLAASRPGSGTGGVVPLLAAINVIPFVAGAVVALVLTLGSRVLAGLPLRTRDTLRDFGANLAGATIWIALVLGSTMVIHHSLAVSQSQLSSWIALVIAIAVASAATFAHLMFVRRIRSDAGGARTSLRSWLAALVCIGILFYSPYSYGVSGVRLLYDYVRPALRSVHVLPTPPLSVAGYTVDVPFHDQRTLIIRTMKDGSASRVSVPFPSQYGLTGLPSMRVDISRRDAPPEWPTVVGLPDQSKELKAAEDKAPGQDAIILMSTSRYTKLAMRLVDYPDVDINIKDFDRSATQEQVEQALLRFLHERVRRTN